MLDGDAVCADDGDVLSALDENAQEGMSAEEIADVTVLRARVKHLEMQQSLMDGELESMSDLAKQTDIHLRSAIYMMCPVVKAELATWNIKSRIDFDMTPYIP